MTQKDILFSAYHKASEMLYDIEIPIGKVAEVRPNTRSKTVWGWCKWSEDGYIIEIADVLISERYEKELLNTMLHELLHTVKGTGRHNKYWQQLAAKVNAAYGTDVHTTNDYDVPEHGRKAHYAHVIQCTNCGYMWFYTRAANAVRNAERCKCPFCKTKTIKRITEEYRASH